jgi:hypothetical protein
LVKAAVTALTSSKKFRMIFVGLTSVSCPGPTIARDVGRLTPARAAFIAMIVVSA